ncbi:hypothetical protein BOTBODRAFT_26753 [Botryobasidium botryosum FD-172 SS1]|uniref:Uncharacterized protein n=1 Tax=Botryobasidium botryosum (strain FD-172 SS1) TaxID=930990 RepID=A0A067N9E3_BOTB1|nr:hypothetical protein BOTBODRAFT_26753 [Botryobasidium botryosum FD-172 SS1]
MYRVLRPLKLLSFRAASQMVANHHHPIRIVNMRHQPFSASTPSRASEDENLMHALRDSPLLKQLADNPAAMKSLRDFMDLMMKNGLDMTKKPSTLTMLKLAGNAELREAAKNFVAEIRKAGIDINPQNAMELLAGPNGWPPKK